VLWGAKRNEIVVRPYACAARELSPVSEPTDCASVEYDWDAFDSANCTLNRGGETFRTAEFRVNNEGNACKMTGGVR